MEIVIPEPYHGSNELNEEEDSSDDDGNDSSDDSDGAIEVNLTISKT
jgi:hypothetical protein